MKVFFAGWAKEDAREVVILAIESQLGLTMNARRLEVLIRRWGRPPALRGNQSRRFATVLCHQG